MRRIRRIGPILGSAVLQTGGGQFFAVATFLDEIAFQRGDLLIKQVVGLMNQADDGIGDHGGIAVGKPKGIIGRMGLI